MCDLLFVIFKCDLFLEWSKALLLEKWMTNAVQCCEEAGIAPPASALQLVACSPPLLTPSPPSSIIAPPPPPHIPGGVVEQDEAGRDVKNLVGFMDLIFVVMSHMDVGCVMIAG